MTLNPFCRRDPGLEIWNPISGTRDPRLGTKLIGVIRDLRPGTLEVRPENQGTEHLAQTQDIKRGIWNTYDR